MLPVGVKSVRNFKMYLLCSHGVCNLTVLFGLDGHYVVTMAVKTLKKKIKEFNMNFVRYINLV